MTILEVNHLFKSYIHKGKTIEAVKDVSFSIQKGEVLAFLGQNGAGKTTCIKMISSLLSPDKGYIKINGRDPHKDTIAIRDIGAVLEGNRNVYWRLTTEENIRYFAILRGVKGKYIKDRVRKLIDRFGLADKRKTLVKNLSRGMQQKLAIAVALVHKPSLLLLDEPTLGLDVEASESVKDLIKELSREGHAILLTTHQLNVAEELSHRTAIIKKGEIIAEAATEKLLQQHISDTFKIRFSEEPSSDSLSKLQTMGASFSDHSFTISGDEQVLIQSLNHLKPNTLIKIERGNSSLHEVFLKLVKDENTEVSYDYK